MASYKVPQDVEAEDKFLGPLTFKQFIFAGGGMITGYLMFIFLSKGIWPLAAVILPLFLGFWALAIPWSKDQPTELWLASRIRFMLIPHKRIWDQSGIKELVKITVPKREVHIYTDGLDQDQVRSRLTALADIVDTRGWAVKNVNPNSDRLVDQTSSDSVHMQDEAILADTPDILDDDTSEVAQNFDNMIERSEEDHHNHTLALIEEARRKSGEAETDQPAITPTPREQNSDLVSFKKPRVTLPDQEELPSPYLASSDQNNGHLSLSEAELLDRAHQIRNRQKLSQQNMHGNRRTIGSINSEPVDDEIELPEPLSSQQTPETTPVYPYTPDPSQALQTSATLDEPTDSDFNELPAQKYTPYQGDNASAYTSNPDILALASNDDLNVETIARQAKKAQRGLDDGEVVISLH